MQSAASYAFRLRPATIHFGQHVQQAMQSIYSLHPRPNAQRKWLTRLAEQLTHKAIIDRNTINHLPAFDSGAKPDKVRGTSWILG